MENFKIVQRKKLAAQDKFNISLMTFDPMNSHAYVLVDDFKLYLYNLEGQVVKFLHELKHKDGRIVLIEYVLETESINFYLADGEIVAYNIYSEIEEVIYKYPGKISAVGSSPDQELLAVVLADDKLILSSRGRIFSEKGLHDKHAEYIEKLDVGWGSKETQFHGSEGKDARKVILKPEVPASKLDDRQPKIVWRGDGNYFVTSAIHPVKGNRYLRIWTNEGLLQHESEYVEGLEDQIAWRPDGSLITCSQTIGEKHKIIFFEKNGLTHGQFELPFPANLFKIQKLDWSLDSKVLAIQGYYLSNEAKNFVYFYHRDNYYWYQKYALEFSMPISCLNWNSLSHNELLFVSANQVHQIIFKWEVDRYSDIVAAVDGKNIHLTPFKHVNIPPPMSAFTLCLDFVINEITLIDSTCFLVKSINSLHLITPTGADTNSNVTITRSVRNGLPQLPNFVEKLIIDWKDFDILHFRAISPQKAIGVKIGTTDSTYESYKIALIDLMESFRIEVLCCFSSPIIAIDYCRERSTIVIQLFNGELHTYDLITKKLNDWKLKKPKFPTPCLWIKAVNITNEINVLGMTLKGSLYLNEKLLLSYRCTSFALYDHRTLVLTTNNNHFLSWRLDEFFLQKIVSRSQDPRDEPRSIERGGRIVSLVSEDAKIILQMPRGNIETIHPRTLLLHRLSQLLDEQNYGLAFQIMRKHRINFNLICDHNLFSFVDNIDNIVREIGKDDVLNICLLVSELKNENVTKTMYSFAYTPAPEEDDQIDSSLSKLDKVCVALRESMKRIDSAKYLIPIAVTYVKESKKTIANALKMVFDEKDDHIRDDALKYLLYLTDVETLYKEALGTYNFDIVLMVVQKSQKDPKEYLQYINSLKSIDDLTYRKFKIDVDLKKFESAILHMKELDPNKYQVECVNFIFQNKLYWIALEHILPPHPWLPQILCKFGEYLLSKRYYEEAGIAYEKGKDFVNALKCYQLNGNWNLAVALALRLGEDCRKSHLESIAANLVSCRKHSEAAGIYANYLNNFDKAINTLLRAGLWDEAFRVLSSPNVKSDFTDIFKKELEEYITNLKVSLKDIHDKLHYQYTRLVKVELQKIVERENNPPHYLDDDNDSLSEASSVTGSNSVKSSLATRKSNKSKRKRNYIKYSTKEGHRFEHIALRLKIKETIDSVNTSIEEAMSCIRWLCYYDMMKEASNTQEKVLNLSRLIEEVVKSFWSEVEEFDGKDNVSSSHPLLSDYLKEPSVLVPPKVHLANKEFKLLSV